MVTPAAHPPETLEGWYALHQIYTCRGCHPERSEGSASGSGDKQVPRFAQDDIGQGWSAVSRLVGSMADLMVIHFRESLDGIAEAQAAWDEVAEREALVLQYSFLSVAEAGLYHLTAKLAQEAAARGGAVGDEEYASQMKQRVAAERESDHVRKRLYPALPKDMPWVCFYPMSKRRGPDQNWYALSLEERSRLMHSHGLTGRRYAGRVQQIITGSIGFENWEWGVTLFARDPLDIKKLVTDMRFDEVSAKYGEFGEFFVGKLLG